MLPTRQDLTQGHFIEGFRKGDITHEARLVLLINAGHRITRYNVNPCLSLIPPSTILVPDKY